MPLQSNATLLASNIIFDIAQAPADMGKVFISYSHDSQAHIQLVLQLANSLRAHGIDVELDQYHQGRRPPQGWSQWCEEQLRPENSEFVLVICTDLYRRRVEDQPPSDEGRGVNWEGKIIYSYLYEKKENTRFIPILLGGTPSDIPRPLRDTTRYSLNEFTLQDNQYEVLYRELTKQPTTSKPQLGKIVSLPLIQGTKHPAKPKRPGGDEYEDGTNVQPDTLYFEEELGWKVMPWYRPSESTGSSNWTERWERLRTRFENLIDRCHPAQCNLIQFRHPAYGIESTNKIIRPSRGLCFEGPGLERTACFLHPIPGQTLVGKYLVHGANGRPLITPDGQPHGFRFGFSRYFTVFSADRYQGDPRPAPHPQFLELAQEAAALLYQLPAHVAMHIWRNWPSGFSRGRDSNNHLWLDALFELSWQGQPGGLLYSKRFARKDGVSIGLVGDGLFPRIPSGLSPVMVEGFQNEGGNPSDWQTEIPDVVRASVAAVDEILTVK